MYASYIEYYYKKRTWHHIFCSILVLIGVSILWYRQTETHWTIHSCGNNWQQFNYLGYFVQK